MPSVTGTYFLDFKVDAERLMESAEEEDRDALQALTNSIVMGNG